jgi:hypothetical protein
LYFEPASWFKITCYLIFNESVVLHLKNRSQSGKKKSTKINLLPSFKLIFFFHNNVTYYIQKQIFCNKILVSSIMYYVLCIRILAPPKSVTKIVDFRLCEQNAVERSNPVIRPASVFASLRSDPVVFKNQKKNRPKKFFANLPIGNKKNA